MELKLKMRSDWIQIQSNLDKLEELNLDLNRLYSHAFKFYNQLMPIRLFSTEVFHIMEAKSNFETCLTILKGLIEPKDNPLINEINQKHYSFDVLETYFENFLAIIDSDVKLLQDSLTRRRGLIEEFNPMIVKKIREQLNENMDNLILYPLIKAHRNFVVLDKESIKNLPEEVTLRNVFEYLLFREVFISAKIKGSGVRQRVSIASQMAGATFHETNITKSPRGSTKAIKINPALSDSTPPDLDDLDDIFKDDNTSL